MKDCTLKLWSKKDKYFYSNKKSNLYYHRLEIEVNIEHERNRMIED